MKMLKTLLFAALTPTVIKLVGDGYDWVKEQFSDEEPIPDKPEVKVRKVYDMTPVSLQMRSRIKREYASYVSSKSALDGTKINNLDILTTYLNKRYKLNKSRTTYTKIWNN